MAITVFSQSKYSSVNIPFYNPLIGNYKFDTELTDFGIVKERKMRKINRLGSVLKLSEVKDTNSIYPMIDEFGYSFNDFFIFKSSWDLNYHVETIIPSSLSKYTKNDDISLDTNTNIGKSN